MSRYGTEFKVGLFVLIAGGLVIGSYLWSFDGVRSDEASYVLYTTVDNADGLFAGTPVRLAGVDVGAVEDIVIDGDRAQLALRLRDAYQFPSDSVATLKSSGMLGDRYVNLMPGREDALLQDGGRVTSEGVAGDIDAITGQVERISEDIKAITGVLRIMAENDSNRDNIEATIANVEALSIELRLLAEQNRSDVNATVDAIRRLAEALEAQASTTGGDIDEEMTKVKELTDTLQEAVDNVESITSKVDGGEGTVGALINDRETIDALNETIDSANAAIDNYSGLRAEVYYVGRYFFGSEPSDTDTFFLGNAVAGTGFNTIGIELHSQEDFWYTFEINSYPLGTVTFEETYIPDQNYYKLEWIRKPDYRYTFMMGKRFWDFGVRLGVKENGGAIGLDYWLFRDRLRFSADLFDFSFGAYPLVDETIPNLRVAARFEPYRRLYIEAGMEQILLGARYGYATGYIGGGFRFDDDDVKILTAALPGL